MLIVDSSFLIAYHNKEDINHFAAAKIMEDLVSGKFGSALLLEHVFLEVVTVLLTRKGRGLAISADNTLLQAREVESVPCTDLFIDTLETIRSQKKPILSLTDAAIVTVRRYSGIHARDIANGVPYES